MAVFVNDRCFYTLTRTLPHAVFAVLEEAPRIAGRNGVQGRAHRLNEALSGTRGGFPEKRLDLGEGLLYGVEVRREGGRYTSSQPLPSISSRTRPPLCEERLSITTICPGLSVGASVPST